MANNPNDCDAQYCNTRKLSIGSLLKRTWTTKDAECVVLLKYAGHTIKRQSTANPPENLREPTYHVIVLE